MDDIQLLIYIIFVVVALLSRFLSKKKALPPRDPGQEGPEEKPVSFEDLLREFSEKTREVREHSTPMTKAAPQKVERKQEYRQETISDEEVTRRFEESVRAAKIEKVPESALSDRLVHFKNYETEDEGNPFAESIREMLKNPDDVAKAVVLSEIINRKY